MARRSRRISTPFHAQRVHRPRRRHAHLAAMATGAELESAMRQVIGPSSTGAFPVLCEVSNSCVRGVAEPAPESEQSRQDRAA